MSALDPVYDAADGLLGRVAKAASAAVAAGLAAAGSSLAAGADPLQAFVAGAVALLGGFGVTYGTRANRP